MSETVGEEGLRGGGGCIEKPGFLCASNQMRTRAFCVRRNAYRSGPFQPRSARVFQNCEAQVVMSISQPIKKHIKKHRDQVRWFCVPSQGRCVMSNKNAFL